MFDLTYLDSINVKYNIKDHMALCNYDILSVRGTDADKYRARIIDINTGETLSFSFNRFYNYGEFHAAKIDHTNCSIYEKLDGTLIVFFHNGYNWDFHTRSIIDASGSIGTHAATFRHRVLNLLKSKGFNTVDDFCKHVGLAIDNCLACEYVGPYNRLVTHYRYEDLYLLRVTNKITETTINNSFNWPFSYPHIYTLNSNISLTYIEQLTAGLTDLKEGFVLVDKDDQRVKVKSPSYLAMFAACNAGQKLTLDHYCQMVLTGDTEEIKSYFPEYTNVLNLVESVVTDLCNEALTLYETNKHLTIKSFALLVNKHPLQGWLFERFKNKTNAHPLLWIRETTPRWRLAEWVSSRHPNLIF